MSSGTPWDPGSAFGAASKAIDARLLETSQQLGLSKRQRDLQALWKRYKTIQYADRKIAWDGTKEYDPDESEQISSAGFLPEGYVDTSGASLPIRFRKPSSPYHLFRVIVDRFTSLLFAERRNPKLNVKQDPAVEQFVRALASTARLWPMMARARTYGGAMGSVAIGFQFVKGKPTIEVHNPIWLDPEFVNRFTLEVRSIDKRFMFPQEKRDEKGHWQTVLYWYRRTIDQQSDTTYLPMEVTEEEPTWIPDPQATFEHGLGFCPIVWLQNLPEDDDVDGAPDCEGCLDNLEALDQILSQTHSGVKANGDPTLVIAADGEMNEVGGIQTGSDNVIKMGATGKAMFLEVSGASLEAGLKMAEKERSICLEVSQCVLDDEATEGPASTATEINRRYSSMLAKSGLHREQYGEHGVIPLLQMMCKAAEILTAPVQDDQGMLVSKGLRLSGWDGPKDAATGLASVPVLPEQIDIGLMWPDYFEPSLDDVEKGARAAAGAKAGGIIDAESATRFAAPLFKIDDPDDVVAKVAAEKAQADADQAMQSINSLNGRGPPPAPGGAPPAAAATGGGPRLRPVPAPGQGPKPPPFR